MRYLEELASVLVAVVDPDGAAEEADVCADAEIIREHGQASAVLLEDHLSLEEDALRGAAVGLLGLADHDGVVLEVVEDDELPDFVVLKTALDNALLEVPIEPQDLYNKYFISFRPLGHSEKIEALALALYLPVYQA